MRIRAVNGTFGGASHDSHIWNLSSEREYLKTNYENGDTSLRILGKFFDIVQPSRNRMHTTSMSVA